MASHAQRWINLNLLRSILVNSKGRSRLMVLFFKTKSPSNLFFGFGEFFEVVGVSALAIEVRQVTSRQAHDSHLALSRPRYPRVQRSGHMDSKTGEGHAGQNLDTRHYGNPIIQLQCSFGVRPLSPFPRPT